MIRREIAIEHQFLKGAVEKRKITKKKKKTKDQFYNYVDKY